MNNYDIVPLFDNVLCLPEEKEKTTSYGIALPEGSKEGPNVAIVEAVGKGKYENGVLLPMYVQVGDKVLYKQWGTNTVKLNGKEYLLIAQTELLSVLKEKA